MESTPTYVPLLIVLALAFGVPVVLLRFRRFGIPIVVGEIIAGIVVGESGLRLVPGDDPLLNLLAQFGFVFLMFLAGLEVDFSSLRGAPGVRGAATGKHTPARRAPSSTALGLAIFALTLVLAMGVGLLLVRLELAGNPWMVALILSTTSLGVVMPVLKERGLSTGRFGQAILLAALIADFGTMLLITVLVAALSRGLTLDILVIGLLFVAFFLMVRLGAVSSRVPGVRRVMEELSHATAQIKVRAALAIMLAFIALSQVLGTEIILGAFLAGAVLALIRTPDDAELGHQLEAMGFGFFIPLFFIEVGVRFDLAALIASPSAMLLVPVLVVAAVAVKLIPGLLLRTAFSWRETLSAGMMLSARLSLIIAASAVGLRLGLVSESLNAAIILVAIVTVTLAPLVFSRIAPAARAAVRGPIVIFGANELGLAVAQRLAEHREHVVLADPDVQALGRAQQHGLDAVCVDVSNGLGSLAAHLEHAAAVVATHHDLRLSEDFCAAVRSTYGIETVVASVPDRADMEQFRRLGAMPVSPLLDHAALLALVSRNPSMYGLLTRTDDDKEVWEVAVRADEVAGRKLREVALPGDVLVLAVRRDTGYLVPHGHTSLAAGDVLTLIGSAEWVEPARGLFETDGARGNGLSEIREPSHPVDCSSAGGCLEIARKVDHD